MMLKFRNEDDKKKFYIEIERFDLLESTEPVPEDLIESFIKRRFSLVKKLKDFRKSQNAKRTWKRHRYSLMKGLKKWHKSFAGKKFHRKLGRFLATRITDSLNELALERYETLKALSSLRTHLLIESEYFNSSVEDDVELEIIFEYSLPLIASLEAKLLESDYDGISEDELENLIRLVGETPLIESLSEITDKSQEEFFALSRSLNINEDLTYALSSKFYKMLNNNKQVNYLMELMEVNEI